MTKKLSIINTYINLILIQVSNSRVEKLTEQFEKQKEMKELEENVEK